MTACEAIWNLNELEIVDGEIWANVWQTDRIAHRPETGSPWIDLTGLLSESDRRTHRVDVLNGIARQKPIVSSSRANCLAKLFEIEVVHPVMDVGLSAID